MTRTCIQRWSIGIFLSGISMVSFAHTGLDAGAHHGSFLMGLWHPLAGIDHVAAALAVGLWGALSNRRLWIAPATFVSGMALGALAGLYGLQWLGVEWMIACSVLFLGGVIYRKQLLPPRVSLLAIAIFAFAHGCAHGSELQTSEAAAQALAGLMLSTGLLHAMGALTAIYLVRHRPWLQQLFGAVFSILGFSLIMSLMGGAV